MEQKYFKNENGTKLLIYDPETKTGSFTELLVEGDASYGVRATRMDDDGEIPPGMTEITREEYIAIHSDKMLEYWNTTVPQE